MATPTLTGVVEVARNWLADYERVDDFDSDLYLAFLGDAYVILKALSESK